MKIEVEGAGEVEAPEGSSWKDVLNKTEGINPESIVAVAVNRRRMDLSASAEEGHARFIDMDSAEGLDILRHSASHVMAQAVRELFPDVKVTIGPAIEKGFYYDFDYEPGFSPEDLPKIEQRMSEIIKRDVPYEREELSREEAIELFKKEGETYKVELVEEIPEGETVSLYRQGSFTDLCRGPHLPSTGYIKAFKLTALAGAYWRGDERNPMLQRIYGTAFPNQEAVDEYLEWEEEARRRDHRRIGKELELFALYEEIGAGMVVYLPKGMTLRNILIDYERREHRRRGYEEVMGPILMKKEIWEKSGHMANYRDKMYFTEVEDQQYGVKPMNCVAHMLIYRAKVRSWRDLPKRYFEIGQVHRHEQSGELHGLTRVRTFTQDDAHIICTPDQLQDEISDIMDFTLEILELFDFQYAIEVSTRPEDKFIGSAEDYDRATEILMDTLRKKGLDFAVDEGEGAFYGPKIDVKLRDALDRPWQCATIQCDFALPEAFDLTYVGEDNQRHRPAMVHRAILGSVERFLAILTEHYAGAFPSWLAPVQARVLPVADKFNEYAEQVYKKLKDADIRAETDSRSEKLGYKIREAQTQKIPYALVVGGKEQEEGTVAPRKRGGEQLPSMSVEEFIGLLRDEDPTRRPVGP